MDEAVPVEGEDLGSTAVFSTNFLEYVRQLNLFHNFVFSVRIIFFSDYNHNVLFVYKTSLFQFFFFQFLDKADTFISRKLIVSFQIIIIIINSFSCGLD